MYFSGIGNDASLGAYSLTLGSTWRQWIRLPEMDQKSFLASPSYHDESRSGVEEDPSDSPWRLLCSSPRSGRSRIKVDVLRTWSPPESFTFPSATGRMIFHHIAALTLPSHWVFQQGFQMRPSAPIPQCMRPRCLLSRFSPRNAYPRNIPGKTFGPNWCRQVFSRNRVIFDHRSKRNDWAIKWCSEPPFIGCLPIRQEILNVSQKAVTLQGIRPPCFIQTWLQQYHRCPFLNSDYRSWSNSISLWSMWCRRTMIPG